ncbi:hypothetical protein CRENBAI_005482 [Crenichthys baileyi]|uniref:Uncharacterized protein n=1 Tax=Crenichthys baileyi TaxID=28760 RepID=A0AAV9S7D0_9TELE
MGKTPAQQAEGRHRKATVRTAERLHPPALRCRITNIQASQAKTSRCQVAVPPSQHHSDTTHVVQGREARCNRQDQRCLPRRTHTCRNEHPMPKLYTKPTLWKCAPSDLPKIKAPLRKCTPVKRRPTASKPKNMPNTHTLSKNSLARKPTIKPTKGRGPNKPKPKPTKKPRPVDPKINPNQTSHPNHAEPSDPSPRQNRNQDMEPLSEPEPPRSKRCLSPLKANHPSPPLKKTYTYPNIRRTSRTHMALDTQVDFAPPLPQTLRPASRKHSLKERPPVMRRHLPL